MDRSVYRKTRARHLDRRFSTPVLLALCLAVGSASCQVGGQEESGAWAGPDDVSPPGDVLESVADPVAPSAPPHPLRERPREVSYGLDAALLGEALERAESLPRLYGLIVARHGEIEAERHFRGPRLDSPTNVKSVSKTLLSALLGLAIEDGALTGLDEPVLSFFSGHLDPESAQDRRDITLYHLLTMQSGLESTSSRNYGRWVLSSNWVRHAITRPVLADPGNWMVYSTGNSHLLSAALTQATGRSTYAFARDRLAEPLGIQIPPWLTDPQGIYFGGNDMQISARGLYRFGEMYRNGGRLDDRQILPSAWVEDSWDVHARSPRNGDSYGLGWWGRESNGYQVRFAWGYGGQFLFVVPALELTVVFTSDPVSPREGPHNQALHRMLDQLLVPAAMAGATQVAGRQ